MFDSDQNGKSRESSVVVSKWFLLVKEVKIYPVENNCLSNFMVLLQMLIVKSTPLFFTASRNQVHSSISKLFFDEVIRQNVKSFLTEAERQFGLESIERQNPKIYAQS